MPTVQINCPHCAQRLAASEDLEVIKCPTCKKDFSLWEPPPVSPPVPAPAPHFQAIDIDSRPRRHGREGVEAGAVVRKVVWLVFAIYALVVAAWIGGQVFPRSTFPGDTILQQTFFELNRISGFMKIFFLHGTGFCLAFAIDRISRP